MLAGTVNRVFEVARLESLLTIADRFPGPPTNTFTPHHHCCGTWVLKPLVEASATAPAKRQKETEGVAHLSRSASRAAESLLPRGPSKGKRRLLDEDSSARVAVQKVSSKDEFVRRGSDEATRDPLSERHGGESGTRLADEANRSRLTARLSAGFADGSQHSGVVQPGRHEGEGEKKSAGSRHGGKSERSALRLATLGALVEGASEVRKRVPVLSRKESFSLETLKFLGTVSPGAKKDGELEVPRNEARLQSGAHAEDVKAIADSAEGASDASAGVEMPDSAEAAVKADSAGVGKFGKGGRAVSLSQNAGESLLEGDPALVTSGDCFPEVAGSRGADERAASVSGRTPDTARRMSDTARRKAKLKAAVSQAKQVGGSPLAAKNWSSDSGLLTGAGSVKEERSESLGGVDFTGVKRPLEPERVAGSRGVTSGSRGRVGQPDGFDLSSSDGESSDPADWFDGADLGDSDGADISDSDADVSDSEAVKESLVEPSINPVLTEADEILEPSELEVRRGPRGLQRQVSAGRQTADVSAHARTTRVATSRILEASDYEDPSSLDFLHWEEGADVAPSVSIYGRQPRLAGGDVKGVGRPPWKRERHKAKTHENHRRRALERKSQLVSAGLSEHLEADEKVDELEEAENGPEAEPELKSGMPCEVCRRQKKGGCGTARARPQCLKRLLLYPRVKATEVVNRGRLLQSFYVQEPENPPETGGDAEPKSSPYTYSGMRCEVCRRQRKGGCGTVWARPQCLKRLLLYPRAHVDSVEPESEETDFVPSEEAPADAIRKELGLPARSRPMVSYLTSLGFTEDDLKRLVEKNVSTFRLSVGPVKARVDFLRSLGVRSHGLRAMVHKQPTVLRYRIDRVLLPRVTFLRRLGVPEGAIAGIVTAHPALLELRPATLEPKVRFLTETLGISASKVVNMVVRQPQVLEKSVHNGLQPRADYFLKEIGVPLAAFANMVWRHPQLLQYSIEKGIKPRIDFLRAIGLTPDERIECITKFPPLLSLSVDTCLRPKYEYLISQLGGSNKTVVDFPAYFSLSLEHRIIPRFNDLSQLDRGRPLPTSVLMLMLRLSDEEFTAKLDRGRLKRGAKNGELRKNARARGYSSEPKGRGMVRSSIEDSSMRSRHRDDVGRGEKEGKDDKKTKFFFRFDGEEQVGASAAANAPEGTEKVLGRFRRQVTW